MAEQPEPPPVVEPWLLSTSTKTLFNALMNGDLPAARQALAVGADAAMVFQVDVPGTTWPPSDDQLELADQGVPPTTPARLSMLAAAGGAGCAAAVPLLLAAGARVTLRDINQTISSASTNVLAALLAAA